MEAEPPTEASGAAAELETAAAGDPTTAALEGAPSRPRSRSRSHSPSSSSARSASSSDSERDEEFIPVVDDEPEILKAERDLQKFIWDTRAWAIVEFECRNMSISDARKMMDRVLEQFPSNALYWADYARMELKLGDPARGLEILRRTLYQYPSEHLWSLYLDYLKTKLTAASQNIQSNVEQMNYRKLKNSFREALEEARRRFGFMLSSKFIWEMSIELEESNPRERDINKLRAIYGSVLSVPIYDLESVWEGYKRMEGLQGELGKRKIAEMSGRFDSAKKILRDKTNIWKVIHVDAHAVPPLGSSFEKEQLQSWRHAIQFELENHEGISKEELCFRMRTIFNQCLSVMRYHPDIWYEFAMFERRYGTSDFTLTVLNEACRVIPNSLYLHFAYADFLESERRLMEAQAVYERLIANTPSTLVYVVYQKFMLRNKSIEDVRTLFQRGISDASCGPELFLVMGNIEYFIEKDVEIARRVFQMGYRRFSSSGVFVEGYARFLLYIGDLENFERLVEASMGVVPSSEQNSLLRMYLQYLQWHAPQSEPLSKARDVISYWATGRTSLDPLDGLLGQMYRYDLFGLSSLSDTDRSLRERYYSVIEEPLGADRLENRIFQKKDSSLLKANLVDGDMPDFVANWIKNLPEPRETEVSSDLLLELLLRDMMNREF